MYTRLLFLFVFLMSLFQTAGCSSANRMTTVFIPDSAAGSPDATAGVRQILENCGKKSIRIVFPKGVYTFRPENAYGKEHYVTNHNNGYKHIGLSLEGFDRVEIDGQGSEFIFHGTMMPLLISGSRHVTIRNLSIDWAVPFFVQGEVLAADAGRNSYDLRMFTEGYAWEIEREGLKFPVGQDFTYSAAGESLVFDPVFSGPVYGAGAFDIHRKSDVRAQRLPDGNIRIFESVRLKALPPVGSIMTFKGPMGENRYAPAIHCIESENVVVEDVNIHHALGMGFLGERSKDITLRRMNVMVREGSSRMVSVTADATHFCNCRGDVLVEECRFEQMLDDGTNVHGTYVTVSEVAGPRTLIARLQHFQQGGFVFAEEGDEVWFLLRPSSARGNENRVVSCTPIDEFSMRIVFARDLPDGIGVGDLIENKTWNTDSFILRDCSIAKHRARNIVLKTPNKVVVENNRLQSMMASILIRGEAFLWYESGASQDVTIRNNRFERCVFGGGNQAVLHVVPRLNDGFDDKQLFDRNIVFEHNTVTTFDNMIVTAVTVDGLILRNNTFIQDTTYVPFNAASPLIDLVGCRDVTVEGNTYQGDHTRILKMDARTRQTAVVERNSWDQ